MKKNVKMGEDTKAIHGGNKHTNIGEHIYPLFQTSCFAFKDADQGARRFAGKEAGYIYSRVASNPQLNPNLTTNPTIDLLAHKIALLEGAEMARIYPTGMAAVATTTSALLKAGDHFITDSIVYGCSDNLFRTIFPRMGIQVSFIDTNNIKELKQTLKKNTKVVFLESPSNPTLKTVDIKKVVAVVKKYNSDIKIVVDNTFATPIYQKPLALGADIVVHSCTKYLNGHGDVVAGAAAFNMKLAVDLIHQQTDFGTTPSPFDCWLMIRGLKTLPLRMRQHTANAKKVAAFLKKHPKIKSLNYPGFSGMITFELKGGVLAGKKLLNNLKLCTLAVSLGNVDSLICHPASMTHAVIPKTEREKAGITDGLVRLSVGIENVEDIIADLKQGLSKI